MKKMLKTLLVATLVIASLLSLLSVGLAEEEITISFFHRWPNEPKGPYMDEVVAKFEEANPNIKIQLIDPVLNDSYKEKIRVLVGSSDIPDVFMSWSG
ncbi:MAG: extracellular solute-binding protein, partial [Clostridiales bacterium]|nr:extracellular solute-binding protein [Clostridiales bacterium]